MPGLLAETGLRHNNALESGAEQAHFTETRAPPEVLNLRKALNPRQPTAPSVNDRYSTPGPKMPASAWGRPQSLDLAIRTAESSPTIFEMPKRGLAIE